MLIQHSSSPEAEVTRGLAVERRGRDAGAGVRLPVEGIRGHYYGLAAGTSTGVGRVIWKTRRGPGSRQEYGGFRAGCESGTVRTLTGSSVTPPRLVFVVGRRRPRAYVVRSHSRNGGGGVLVVPGQHERRLWLGALRGQLGFRRSLADAVPQTGVVDRLGIVAIAEPGRDYEFRVTLTNDALGRGAEGLQAPILHLSEVCGPDFLA